MDASQGKGVKRGKTSSKRLASLALVAFLGCLLGLPHVSLAATVKASWEHHPSPEAPDIPDGFRLYQRPKDGPAYTYGADHAVATTGKGVLLTEVKGVPDGHWCYVVTAFDLKGNESGPSEEACIEIDTTSPVSPTKPSLEVIVEVRIKAATQ